MTKRCHIFTALHTMQGGIIYEKMSDCLSVRPSVPLPARAESMSLTSSTLI